MDITIHPRIPEHSLKILQYRYQNYEGVVKVLKSLPLTEASKKSLEKIDTHRTEHGGYPIDAFTVDDFFKQIEAKDILVVVRDILIDEVVKSWAHSNYNVYWDYIKTWRPMLLDYLKENGIQYDEEHTTFQTLNQEAIVINSILRSTPLVSSDFDDTFFVNLVKEINGCFQSGFYTSSVILSRKLVENLFIEVLRKKFPQNVLQNRGLYFTDSSGRFRDFSDLIKSLELKKRDFPTLGKEIGDILSLADPFRERANSSTHSITSVTTKEEVENLNVDRIVSLLKYVLDRI